MPAQNRRLLAFNLSRFLTAVSFLGALAAAAPGAHAQTTLFQTGFETSDGYSTTYSSPITFGTTTFTPASGNLYEQPRPNSNVYNFFDYGAAAQANAVNALIAAVNATTVVNTTAKTGVQSVEINGTTLGAQGVEYSYLQNLNAGANAVLTASVDLMVANPSASYGQWGINLTNYTGGALSGGTLYTDAAFGFVAGNVLGSPDGTNLYAAFNLSTGVPYTASYGAFNNYSVQMNFASQTISGYFNGTQVGFVPINAQGQPIGNPVLNMPFRANVGNTITDATFGQAIEGTTENGFFDNLRVTGTNVTVAPEPISLTLFGLGMLGAGGFRRKQRVALREG